MAIYTTRHCPGCRPTKQMFDRAGVEYEAVGLVSRLDVVDLVLAADNAGPDNVDLHWDIPPFAETRAYMKWIRAAVETSALGRGRAD